jgi:serine/threonine protein phosphatase PrpC
MLSLVSDSDSRVRLILSGMRKTLRYSVQSQVGLRPNNEDAAFAGPRLLALADGMGGHAAGEVAASLALAEMAALEERPPGPDFLGDLQDAVRRANVAIASCAEADPQSAGMGTTLTAIVFAGQRIGLVHVGDSRAYLLRRGSLVQLTRDDTLVQSLVDQGQLTAEDARHHPQRSIVTKVLTGHEVEPFLDVLESQSGDRYLICSDGLSDYVPPDVIARGMSLFDPLRCPQELIRLALQHGSQDNITCVVGEVTDGYSGFNVALTSGATGTEARVASAVINDGLS